MRFQRAWVWVCTLMMTCAAGFLYWLMMSSDGIATPLEWFAMLLFLVLAGWASCSINITTLGFFQLLRQRHHKSELHSPLESMGQPNRRRDHQTAILVPIYNESPTRVFAGVEAMYRSLAQTEQPSTFDFFILSDTTKSEVWLAEETLLRSLRDRLADDFPNSECNVFYRHRSRNSARKSGNVAEFCRKWGTLYSFMIILDADSLLEGTTMVEMVRKMDSDDQLGIYQVPPMPIGRESLFARFQQFSIDVYGPIYNAGLASFAGDQANYFGHNAILRVKPFMRHCNLPVLPGTAPLGGEILSHDFVEAALMIRAGYKVEIADRLGGSYEECPTTLADFVQREQRWCQGNLQHARLLLCEGFRPLSRLHFLGGVLSYCSAPLWILFMASSFFAAASADQRMALWPAFGLILFVATMLALLAPKVLSLVAIFLDRKERLKRGRSIPLIASFLVETLISVLLSPLLALHHSRFVLSNLAGFCVSWKAQRRDEHDISWKEAIRENAAATRVALVVTLILYAFTPNLLPWFAPILVGLWLATPMSVVLGSRQVGRWCAKANLLSTQHELNPPPIQILRDQAVAAIETASVNGEIKWPTFDSATQDTQWIAFHNQLLAETATASQGGQRATRAVEAVGIFGSVPDVPDNVRFEILTDPDLLAAIPN